VANLIDQFMENLLKGGSAAFSDCIGPGYSPETIRAMLELTIKHAIPNSHALLSGRTGRYLAYSPVADDLNDEKEAWPDSKIVKLFELP
jgi:hypothetical protein